MAGQLELFDAEELGDAESPQPSPPADGIVGSVRSAPTGDTPAALLGKRHEIGRECEVGRPVVLRPEVNGQSDRGDAEEAWPIPHQVLSFWQRVIAAGRGGESTPTCP